MAAFIDEITLHIRAGHGGNGVVRWRHEKGKDKAGAAGGDGGWGGDVLVRGVRNLNILANYRRKTARTVQSLAKTENKVKISSSIFLLAHRSKISRREKLSLFWKKAKKF